MNNNINDPAGWPKRKNLATSKVSPSGSALHHTGLRPSHLDSPQEPEKDRVAPLRQIALRRSSQWQNHQNSKRKKLKLKEPCKISLSVLKCSQSVKKCSKRAYLRSSLEFLIYLCIFSLLTVTPLDTWLASNYTRVTIWNVFCLSATSTLQAVGPSYSDEEQLGA